MANVHVLDNVAVTVGAVTIDATSVTLTKTNIVNAFTTFGDSGPTQAVSTKSAGDTVAVTYTQHFADATTLTLMGYVGTKQEVKVRAGAGDISATNPEFVATCAITEYTPLDGEAGGTSTNTMTWPVEGAIRVLTTPA